MNNTAITYLMKNQILHMGMLEPIRRGTAELLYAGVDGVLLREEKSDVYMISVDNFEKARELLDSILECGIIICHQRFMVDYISSRFEFNRKLECFQAVYMSKNKLEISNELDIKELGQSDIEVVLENYDKLPRSEVEILLEDKALFGGYKNGELIGFIGNHLEGALGILEVFPQYRRLGYGVILESYMVNRMIEKGLIPFGQIEINNKKSLALQKKLGFTISEDSLFLMF